MTCTEIHGITKNSAERIGETKNSWRGGMAVWTALEKKYLPKYIPEWAKNMNTGNEEYSRTTAFSSDAMKEIWDLFKSEELSESERIVLGSTFDHVLVKVENVDRLLKAFREFEGNTSLKDQADIIEKGIAENPEIVAIGWNQTSVNGDVWTSTNYNEELEEYAGYNLEKDTKHWFLIESIKESEIEKEIT